MFYCSLSLFKITVTLPTLYYASVLLMAFPWWLSSNSSLGHLFISQNGDCPVDRCAQGVLYVIPIHYMSRLHVSKAHEI